MDGKDGQGLKLEKMRPTFSSFDTMPAKITKTLPWLVLPDEIWMFDIFFITLLEYFMYMYR